LARAETALSSRAISRPSAAAARNSGSIVVLNSGRPSNASRPASLPEPLGKRIPSDPNKPRIVFCISRRWRTK
jgi:hypothetical protein